MPHDTTRIEQYFHSNFPPHLADLFISNAIAQMDAGITDPEQAIERAIVQTPLPFDEEAFDSTFDLLGAEPSPLMVEQRDEFVRSFPHWVMDEDRALIDRTIAILNARTTLDKLSDDLLKDAAIRALLARGDTRRLWPLAWRDMRL